jgi:TldD protein
MMDVLTRRKFMKAGAAGVALATLPGVFKFDPALAFATPPKGSTSIGDYYDHFGIDESVIREVIAAALERGGDYCDLYFEHRISNWVGLQDMAVNRAYCTIDFGVGIRVLEGEQTGYSYTEEVTPTAMKLAAKTASNIASDAGKAQVSELAHHATPDYYPIRTLWENVSVERKVPLLLEINEKITQRDKRVIKSQVWLGDQSSYNLIVTSEGRAVCDYRPMINVYAACTAEQNGQREQNWCNVADRRGIEYLTPKLVERVAHQAVDKTVALFEAVKPEGGEMEVVLSAGHSGILLHEAIGHGMEADFNRKNESIYSDKVGKPIAEKFVSIVDDGTCEGARGALNVDDEGNDTQKTMLVENGILTTYLHDRISARHYSVKPTGNGRRQSFRHPAMPRMRCTYMLNGPHTKDEIIGSVKKGLYAVSFTNGEVHIGPGDFTFYVKDGFLIEDGKLTQPVKDINIIGNGPQVLKNVVMVGDDFKLADSGGTCGKNGQGVPVSMGLPTVKVSAITVGGVSS